MSEFTVTVVGAGVIGTSIGLAMKQEDDPPRLLVHDKDLSNAKAAVTEGAFDKAEWNLVNACEKADLIILAIPLNGIRPTLEAIAPYLKQGVVISDTSRSKASSLAWAEELLPDHAHFVGGNPLVSPGGSGYEYATANLFRNQLYCLVPATSANDQAVQLVVDLINILGAKPFFLDATEHDGLVTAVEHLPILISAALMNTLSEQTAWRETRKLAGKLFEEVSAGAVGDPDDLREILLSNRENLLRWLDNYTAQLHQLRTLLADEEMGEPLTQLLDKAVVERHNWRKDYEQGNFTDPELTPAKMETPGLMKRLIGFGR